MTRASLVAKVSARVAAGVVASVGLYLAPAFSMASEPEPLAPFQRLIGGQWVMGSAYQTLEWGVGRRSVVAKSYQRDDKGDHLVSEGIWFFHPGEQTIVGYFTAVGMGISLFEYQTVASEAGLQSEITAWDEQGRPTKYQERWILQGDERYLWQLFAAGEGNSEPVSEGVFTRRFGSGDSPREASQ
ncbi:MAG: hypothetical protein WBN78_07445 [Gammaproteobacteria bacterium]